MNKVTFGETYSIRVVFLPGQCTIIRHSRRYVTGTLNIFRTEEVGLMKRDNATKKMNMTEGGIRTQMLLFFFPLMIGTFFQMLYNTVDALIVGRYVGTEALSAVGGSASSIINMFVGLFFGLSSGVTVVVSHSFGAGKKEDVQEAVHTSVALALLFGLFMSVMCFAASRFMLEIMHTADMELSLLYLRIYSCGMIVNVLYNVTSGIFRAVGDSRSPFYFLVVSTVVNIILDMLFIVGFHWGVAGAAAATIMAQAVSALLSIWVMSRKKESYQLFLNRIHINGIYFRKIVSIGIPAGIQSMTYNLSNAVIQSAVNGFGTETVAAWAVFGKLDSIFWMMINSMGATITTFVGQNYGAGKHARVRGCIVNAFAMMMIGTVGFTAFIHYFAPSLFGIFTNDAAVIEVGTVIARLVSLFYIAYVFIEVFSASLRGMGDVFIPTIITLTGICALRILWIILVVPHFHTIRTAVMCYPITWTVTGMLFPLYYFYTVRKRRRKPAMEIE